MHWWSVIIHLSWNSFQLSQLVCHYWKTISVSVSWISAKLKIHRSKKKKKKKYNKFKKTKSFEPPHDKTNKMSVRPAKTHTSLGIRPVWSESLLCAQWVAKYPGFLHADSEDWSDWADAQTGLSLHWAHTHFVGFVVSQLFFFFRTGTNLTVKYEPCHEKTCLLGFQPGKTQTGLLSFSLEILDLASTSIILSK